MAGTKEPWSDTIGRVVWNLTAPVTDDGGGIIKGTGIKAGQEVIYSKIIRKILKADNKSWMHLVLFSLVTAAFDEGLGAWWGDHKFPDDQGVMDVLKEFPRPVLSCLAVNYVFASTSLGIHNPLKSIGFKELLIMLAAKDAAEAGNAVLYKNVDSTRDAIGRWANFQGRQQNASRLKKT